MGRHTMAEILEAATTDTLPVVPAEEAAASDALTLSGVTKVFRSGTARRGVEHIAVRELDLSVRPGTVHALLGPNGAGKTTTVSMVATLLRPDAGEILVDGVDAVKHPGEVREIIGVSGQYAAVDQNLTGFENLRMTAQLYGMSRRAATAVAREMIDRLDLTAAADRPARTYSGGMRRRLDLAGALLNKPRLVILDEPTTGLDPRGRRQIWDIVRDLVAAGTTILLTTQYLEEADELADQITVIDHGAIRAHGTPDELKAEYGMAQLTVEVAPESHAADVRAALTTLGPGSPRQLDSTHWEVAVAAGTRSAVAAVKSLDQCGVNIVDAIVTAPTLDAVFLQLTESADRTEAVDGR
ncbi:ABC transporter ATP-binding protein [Jongsikchunia kroppenstedtii]|uniref:ABC transporter ATP-binding protein n=1 Tax=Jongsikchunia kroppenstedtii TaxID=1121721 RepID=UPI00039A10C4|nr:ATP-binding cassette domain-containing protein [Jongsikchunia kroppenstedtii]